MKALKAGAPVEVPSAMKSFLLTLYSNQLISLSDGDRNRLTAQWIEVAEELLEVLWRTFYKTRIT